jgi:hypothetical protein
VYDYVIMIVWKDIFRPGAYQLPDGRTLEFTDRDVRESLSNGLAMLRNRYAVPTIYEHDDCAKPAPIDLDATNPNWPESFARKAIGHVQAFEIRNENGRPVLWSQHEIPNPEDAKRWAACRYASPRLEWDTTDSKGNRYPGVSVQHVAVTPRPIQVEQLPVNLSSNFYRSPVNLSMEYLKMASEKDEKTGGDGGASGGEFARIRDALSSMGHTLPDSVSDWSSLATALEVLAANGGTTEPDGDEMGGEGGDMGGDDGATTTANPPVMLSAQQRKVHDRLVAVERRAHVDRAEKATGTLVSRGLMTSDQAKKFVGKFGTANLSFASDGSVAKIDLVTQLESYETIAANARRQGGKAANLSNTVSIGQPQINARDPKLVEERQKAATELIMSMTTLAKK